MRKRVIKGILTCYLHQANKTTIKVRKADILKRAPTARDSPAQSDRAPAKGKAGLKMPPPNCLAGVLQAVPKIA